MVSDPELKHRIRLAAEIEERENYERRFPEEWLQALAPLGTDWHKEFLDIAPYLIVVFRIDYGLDDTSTERAFKKKHYYVMESVGIATGMLLTALHTARLASLTHTPSPMGFLRDILGRPKNETPFVLIPVGYPAEHNARTHPQEEGPRRHLHCEMRPIQWRRAARVSSRFRRPSGSECRSCRRGHAMRGPLFVCVSDRYQGRLRPGVPQNL